MAEQTSAERFEALYDEYVKDHPLYFPADEHMDDFARWLYERCSEEISALRQRIAELEGEVRRAAIVRADLLERLAAADRLAEAVRLHRAFEPEESDNSTALGDALAAYDESRTALAGEPEGEPPTT